MAKQVRTDADVLVQDFMGAQHGGQVEQRLAHTHEHDVGHALHMGEGEQDMKRDATATRVTKNSCP